MPPFIHLGTTTCLIVWCWTAGACPPLSTLGQLHVLLYVSGKLEVAPFIHLGTSTCLIVCCWKAGACPFIHLGAATCLIVWCWKAGACPLYPPWDNYTTYCMVLESWCIPPLSTLGQLHDLLYVARKMEHAPFIHLGAATCLIVWCWKAGACPLYPPWDNYMSYSMVLESWSMPPLSTLGQLHVL